MKNTYYDEWWVCVFYNVIPGFWLIVHHLKNRIHKERIKNTVSTAAEGEFARQFPVIDKSNRKKLSKI
jgi:phage terminase large subunit-like protein